MAQLLNLTVFEGFLGSDAEVKTLQSGKSVVSYRVANTRKYKAGDGQIHQETVWMNVVDWKPSAASLAKYLTKGKPVKVIGRLSSRDYEDKNGVKRTAIEIVADNVLLGNDSRDNQGANTQNTPQNKKQDMSHDWNMDSDEEFEDEEVKPW